MRTGPHAIFGYLSRMSTLATPFAHVPRCRWPPPWGLSYDVLLVSDIAVSCVPYGTRLSDLSPNKGKAIHSQGMTYYSSLMQLVTLAGLCIAPPSAG